MNLKNKINKYKKIIKKTKKNKTKNKYFKIIEVYKILKKVKNEFKKNKILYKEEKENNMLDLIRSELNENRKQIKELKKKIKILKKEKNEKVILEIKLGVGGEESSNFATELKKMYEKYIEKMKWKKKIISENIFKNEGTKEIIIKIKGKNIYKKLKYESGVHRVQRTPKSENKGRIHTSTCRVAIYRKIKKNNISIKNSELKIETFKSSGAGGQHVNKTNSAVRVRHIPTGITVECQKERSQHKNKKHALETLKTKIQIKQKKNISKEIEKIKKKLFGQGDRSEKIRTYNYKENRLTDHIFKFSLKNLDLIMQGNLNIILKKIKDVLKGKHNK